MSMYLKCRISLILAYFHLIDFLFQVTGLTSPLFQYLPVVRVDILRLLIKAYTLSTNNLLEASDVVHNFILIKSN